VTRTKTRMAAASGAVGGWPVLFPRFQFVPADAGRGKAGALPQARRILVVEDEGLVALEIETFLMGAGHDVVGVAAGRAVALALARAERPDLALVDVRLANGDSGLDLAADLSALGVPVLLVTGNCPQDLGRSVALGCLHKPFDEHQLLAAVAAAARLAEGQAVEDQDLPSGLHLYRT
jgi:two-component system, response regulator PdtaR